MRTLLNPFDLDPLEWVMIAIAYSTAFVCLWMVGSTLAHADEVHTASWYSREACRYNTNPRCPTASGRSLYELERNGSLFAAMWDVPMGSRWKVCRADKPKQCVTVAIWDRGPARRLGRKIDLGKLAFSQLYPLKQGTGQVTMTRED